MAEEPIKITFKIRPIDPKAPGFLPMYRQMLAGRRALDDGNNSKPEDIDELYLLLEKHIEEPADPRAKRKAIDLLSIEDLTQVLDEIMGTKIVSPPNDAA
jgi:hypothetical protein